MGGNLYSGNPKELTHIVVHGGSAHRDEVIALGIAFAVHGQLPVFRRDATEDELEDPSVLVLDVGERHEPEKNNFDHHQLPRDAAPACAYTLYAEHVGLDEVLKLRKWYEVGAMLDSKGPFATAKHLGLEKFPFEITGGPIEGQFMMEFERHHTLPVGCFLSAFIHFMGTGMVASAQAYSEQLDNLNRNCMPCEVKGQQVLIFPTDNVEGSQDVRDRLFPEAAVSVSWDDRGEGWSLYRYNDHPAVDFSRLEGDPAVLFAHKGGFIAKTHTRLSVDQVLALVERAIL